MANEIMDLNRVKVDYTPAKLEIENYGLLRNGFVILVVLHYINFTEVVGMLFVRETAEL